MLWNICIRNIPIMPGVVGDCAGDIDGWGYVRMETRRVKHFLELSRCRRGRSHVLFY